MATARRGSARRGSPPPPPKPPKAAKFVEDNSPRRDRAVEMGDPRKAALLFPKASVTESSQFNRGSGGGLPKTNMTPVGRFEFYVTEVNVGYAASFDSQGSRLFQAIYYKAFDQKPLQVKGIAVDEAEYDNLADFIGSSQRLMVTDDMADSTEASAQVASFRLVIPAAGVDWFGYIDSFRGGHDAQGQGFETAPAIEFNFGYIREANREKNAATSQIAQKYFFSPGDAYWPKVEKQYNQDLLTNKEAYLKFVQQLFPKTGGTNSPDAQLVNLAHGVGTTIGAAAKTLTYVAAPQVSTDDSALFDPINSTAPVFGPIR